MSLAGAAIKIAGGAQTTGAGAGLLASANPILAGVSTLSSLFGGGKVKTSGANAFGEASGGYAAFESEDSIGIGGALIDFNNPLKVLLIGGAVALAIYLYKKGGK